jgi:hypothetical protein
MSLIKKAKKKQLPSACDMLRMLLVLKWMQAVS